MRKGLIVLLGLLFVIGLSGLSYAAITGSKHDFTGVNANLDPDLAAGQVIEICKPCHVPHRGVSVAGAAAFRQKLIWGQTANYAVSLWSAADFWYTEWRTNGTQYQAPTTATVGRCMGCHSDISFYLTAALGGYKIDTGLGTRLGSDLTTTHPVGIKFNPTTGLPPGEFKAPGAEVKLTLDGSADQLGCRTCHDPHNKATVADFLVKSNAASALCLDCHTK